MACPDSRVYVVNVVANVAVTGVGDADVYDGQVGRDQRVDREIWTMCPKDRGRGHDQEFRAQLEIGAAEERWLAKLPRIRNVSGGAHPRTAGRPDCARLQDRRAPGGWC